jgi:carbonic anhydrase
VRAAPAADDLTDSKSKDAACVTKVADGNVRQSVQQIRARSPYVASSLDAGKVAVRGAMYDLATGKVTFIEP